jgi:glycosyltransferase involved in cell wall biosynthesis
LEPLIKVLGKMRTKCELHLRGLPSSNIIDSLRHQAVRAGFLGKIEFLPLASAAEMARLAAGYDLGLSLEQRTPLNRDLCLTNKIFTYLIAGVPVALTPTSAQDALNAELGEAALRLDLSEPEKTAALLDSFFQSPERRAAARAAAWRLGQSRFNWDHEQANLLSAVEWTLNNHTSAQSVVS